VLGNKEFEFVVSEVTMTVHGNKAFSFWAWCISTSVGEEI
jgi:hypothetical protein